MPKKSQPKAGRVVRKQLADGTIKEYRYGAWKPGKTKAERAQADTISALLRAFRASPEFASRAPATKVQYGIYLRVWDEMGHVRVAEVTRRTVMTLRDAVVRGSGPGAANAFSRISGALFAWAVDRGWRENSPAYRIRALPGGHLKAWTIAQAIRAERELPEHLSRVVTLARYTGQRRGDLCAMTWSAYDGTSIRLRQSKTGVALVIPCHPVLKEKLDEWKAKRGEAVTILLNGWGRPWVPEVMSGAMQRGLAKIGMTGINVHGLRKLAAAELAQAGCTLHEIQAVTGHTTLAMVELYTKTASQETLAKRAITRLSASKPL